jgi:hypothetical protein
MSLEDLLYQLEELCTCDAEDLCIYCDAREQIEAQQRTITLLQERLQSGKSV